MSGSGLMVTATDTEVGKTWVTAGLSLALQSRGVKTGVFKPVQSGHLREHPKGDGMRLKSWTGVDDPIESIVPYSYSLPVAPGLAAELEGTAIDREVILRSLDSLARKYDGVLVEGAGGWMTPLGESWTIADLAREIGWPVLIVARPDLGTVNHTALTVRAIRSTGLEVAGVVLNGGYRADDPSVDHNPRLIESFAGVPVLGRLPWLEDPGKERLRQAVLQNLDLEPVQASIRLKKGGSSGVGPG
ncbi:dethiobiotin synthetase [Melghirimyces profundicolus]|uniref:ATP-dependent dethiobiotin synthetase BioD n=1 Tax=Melghirimyces profundicolus TaxID=1242148 RepID=A0A2T6C7X9_9BACL|nr:dethiobiotin synthase [Melghirimyces profundicolus]PTX64393.1 dethiobiotin synthetase [Melghirimyces profundicolus]